MLHRPGLTPADEAPDLSFWPDTKPGQGQKRQISHSGRIQNRDRVRSARSLILAGYKTGTGSTAGMGEAAYWLPILALYTGARLEELGQLRPCDVIKATYLDDNDQDSTAWVISITSDEADGLHLKNSGSVRVIPIHDALLQLGFIRFVEMARAAKQVRIFDKLKPNKYGVYTAKWGEWFSQYRRTICGLTDRRLVFHSFRHTFKDMARNCGMIEGIQRQIMGHSGEDIADDYGDGYSLAQTVAAMSIYRVPAFTLPPVWHING